jgi:hypothetical protein
MLNVTSPLQRPSSPYEIGGLVLLTAVAVILAALAFEHIGGYTPCPLCLQQRYAYYAGIPALLAALYLVSVRRPGPAAAIFALVAIAFLVNAALALPGRRRMGVLGAAGHLLRPWRLAATEHWSGKPRQDARRLRHRQLAAPGPLLCGLERSRLPVSGRWRGHRRAQRRRRPR